MTIPKVPPHLRKRGEKATGGGIASSDAGKARLFLVLACIWPLVLLAVFSSSAPQSSHGNNDTNSSSVRSVVENPSLRLRKFLDRVDVVGYGPTHPRVSVVVVGDDTKEVLTTVESVFGNTDMSRLFVVCIVMDGIESDPKLLKRLQEIDQGSVPHWHGMRPDKHNPGEKKGADGGGEEEEDEPHGKKTHVIFNKAKMGVAASRSDAADFISLLSKRHEQAGWKSPEEDLLLLLMKSGTELTSRKWLAPVTSALIVPPPLMGAEDTTVALKMANAISFGIEGPDNDKAASFHMDLRSVMVDPSAKDMALSSGNSFPSPRLAGAATAMRLETFHQLPAQDLSLGGEYAADLDLAMNLWMCADGIDVLKDVNAKPATGSSKTEELTPNEAARFAAAWMDEIYGERVFQALIKKHQDLSRLKWETMMSSAKGSPEFPQNLQSRCRPFSWYAKEINLQLGTYDSEGGGDEDPVEWKKMKEAISKYEKSKDKDTSEGKKNNVRTRERHPAKEGLERHNGGKIENTVKTKKESESENEDQDEDEKNGKEDQDEDEKSDKEDQDEEEEEENEDQDEDEEDENEEDKKEDENEEDEDEEDKKEDENGEDKKEDEKKEDKKIDENEEFKKENENEQDKKEDENEQDKKEDKNEQDKKEDEKQENGEESKKIEEHDQLPAGMEEENEKEDEESKAKKEEDTGPRKPSKPLDKARLDIINKAIPIDITYQDVSDGHKEHPHRGARDADGNWGYIHDETAIIKNPPKFEFPNMKQACAKRDNNYRMLTEKVFVDLEADKEANKKAEEGGKPRVKILCMIYSSESGHERIRGELQTWGQKCDGFMVGSNKTDPSVGAVDIPHEGIEEYNNIYQKVRSMWAYAYDNYYEKYDWFHIGGDDLYLIIENLRLYLESEEILTAQNGGVNLPTGKEKRQTPMFLGRRFAYMGDMQDIFNSGGSGYTLNRAAVKTLVVKGFPRFMPHAHTFSEDTMVARVLKKAGGIYPYETKDETGGERYNPFLPGHHLGYVMPKDKSKDWYAKYSINIKFGLDHCAARSVAFHYAKGDMMKRLHALLYKMCDDT